MSTRTVHGEETYYVMNDQYEFVEVSQAKYQDPCLFESDDWINNRFTVRVDPNGVKFFDIEFANVAAEDLADALRKAGFLQ